MPINITVFRLVMELVQLIVSSRILVLGEVDIAFGNILGSNLFNTLAVVGIAGAIHPLAVGPEGFSRDMLVTVSQELKQYEAP